MIGFALIFPGQGAQSVGMGLDLWRDLPEARATFAEADAVLGFPLSRLCFEGPGEELTRTENAQPAILTVSIASYQTLAARRSLMPKYVAGHSVGEYSALVAAGVLAFCDAVRLVRRRGELMGEAMPQGKGTMAAILGLERETVKKLLAEANSFGVVEVANLNCPGQIVVAGETNAVAEAMRLAKAAGARKAIPLQVSGPFHSSLMRPAADRFAVELAHVDFYPARIPVVANVTAQPVTDPNRIRELLVEQIYSPVRWEESVRFMVAAGVKTFIESGPGKVLSGLVRRITQIPRITSLEDELRPKEAIAISGEV